MPFDGKDYRISNARIIDGSSLHPPYMADLIISGDKILCIEKKGTRSRNTMLPVFDAKGLTLVPGFIDTHSHSDMSLFAAPGAESSISQGITTQVTGNCGLSPFPAETQEVREHLNILYEKYGQKICWKDFSSYAAKLEKCMPATNLFPLCGHNTLKADICGYSGKNCTEKDVEKMGTALTGILQEGANGLSTGLLYMPGRTSSREELVFLMKILKRFDLPYATHLRSEADQLVEAVKEALFLASEGSGKLQISHLKTAKKKNWHKLSQVFDLVEKARSAGMKVTCDRYPWTFSATSLSLLLPGIYQDMTDTKIEQKLAADSKECQILAEKLDQTIENWEKILLADTRIGQMKVFCGKDFSYIGKALSLTPGEAVLKILARDASHAMGAFGGMSEENLSRILKKEYTCCGTDETSRPFDDSCGRSHPRAFSSFPLFFRKLRAEGISEIEAIYKMTGLPAQIFSLHKRGLIREGFYADLLLFDPEKFSSSADFAHPHTPAEGVEAVFVNGRLCDLALPLNKRKRNGKVLKNFSE